MKHIKNKKLKKTIRILIKIFALAFIIGCVFVTYTNAAVIFTSNKKITDKENISDSDGIDCILVLGCGVKADGTPSDMLKDRLDKAYELYSAGMSSKILLSGDHGSQKYDEVNCMKNYMLEKGVEPSDIFLDHAGFSTYDSVVRAKEIFNADKIIIVTQKYHLYRAVFLAEKSGIDAYGIPSRHTKYHQQFYRDIREIAARSKDYIYSIVQPEVTKGETFDISGDGTQTWDNLE